MRCILTAVCLLFFSNSLIAQEGLKCIWTSIKTATTQTTWELRVQRTYFEDSIKIEPGDEYQVKYTTIDCIYNDVDQQVFEFNVTHHPRYKKATIVLYMPGDMFESRCKNSVSLNILNIFPVELNKFTEMSDRRIMYVETTGGVQYQWVSDKKEHLNLIEVQWGDENFLIK